LGTERGHESDKAVERFARVRVVNESEWAGDGKSESGHESSPLLC
jgi:hypothetical protein